jgi:hypothetical protein
MLYLKKDGDCCLIGWKTAAKPKAMLFAVFRVCVKTIVDYNIQQTTRQEVFHKQTYWQL